MKTITALTHTDDGQPANPVPNQIIKGKSVAPPFRRQSLHTATGVRFKSTTGGDLFVTWETLALADPLLAPAAKPT